MLKFTEYYGKQIDAMKTAGKRPNPLKRRR
jgi:hypothetical protein